MRLKRLNFFTVLLVALLQSACIESDGDNPVAADVADLPELAASTLSGVRSVFDTEGRWKGSCLKVAAPYQNMSFRTRRYEFSGSRLTMFTDWFPTDSCSEPRMTAEHVGKLTFGEELTTSSGIAAQEMDIQFDTGVLWKALVAEVGGQLLLNYEVRSNFPRPNDLDLEGYGDTLSKNPTDEEPEPQSNFNLDGVWESACLKGSVDPAYIEINDFLGDQFSFTQRIYSDTSCLQSAGGDINQKGTVILGKDVITPSGIDAKEMTMKFEKFERKGLAAMSGGDLVFVFVIDGSTRPDDVTQLDDGEFLITFKSSSK